MEFKGTKPTWKVKHSQSKNAFNVVGTVLGGTYKIARCPYLKGVIDGELSDVFDERERSEAEAEANALLISKAPEMLEMLQLVVNDLEERGRAYGDIYTMAKQLIKEATNI